MGHMAVSASKDSANISLHLEAKDSPLTFQSLSMDNVIFTNEYTLLYPPMNRVVILLKYIDEKKDFMRLLEKNEVKTDQDYVKKMHYFAARPIYEANLMTSTQHLKGFEYRFDKNESWQFTESNLIKWDASLKTNNLLEVRSVNQFDRKGPITFMEMQYK